MTQEMESKGEYEPVIGEPVKKEKNKKAGKVRLDQRLVELGLAQSRERAKTTVMAGLVLVDGQRIDKAGTLVRGDADIRILGGELPYVSRGGLKLRRAIDCFDLDLSGTIMADIGASTGGFTDCALQHGAEKVYAIDVGYGQLAWKLRTDERVVNMERTNIRNVTPVDIGELLTFASIDVAFISLDKVLPAVWELLLPGGVAAALIKPQFEAGRGKVGKHGVVREPETHQAVIEKVISVAEELGFFVSGLDYSPIKGPEGNIEYLVCLKKPENESDGDSIDFDVAQVVSAAHEALSGFTPAETERNFLNSIREA